LRVSATIAVVAGVATAIGVSACGGSSNNSSSSTGGGGGAKSVDIYSSLPEQGASKAQIADMIKGMKLALSQNGGKAGSIKINYMPLDDSTASAGAWDPAQVATNARKAAQDSKTIGYIGEFNSGGSALSIPILNQAGIPQVSPANTYVGLTTNEPGSAKGEPDKYYPTGKRTYLRIVPRDTIQGLALATLMKKDGCQKVAVANDRDTYGQGLASLFLLKSKQVGLNVLGNTGIDKNAANFRSLAASFKQQGADCFFFAGITANGGAQIFKDVHAALPSAKLYGGDGVCESGLTNPKKGGVPKAVGSLYQCTVAVLNLTSYPGGTQFLSAFKSRYGGSPPDPYGIYGYEAMKLFVDTIRSLGDKGSDRSAVLSALYATKNRQSVLGTYSFDKNGDTSLTDYGVYKVGPDGDPVFETTIKQGG
jgi:branched-chain amino acid transport system substrate-binding protein